MRMGCAYLAATGLFLGMAGESYAVKIALTAVKKNNAPVAPTNEILAAPGDTIETNILISDWADELYDGIRLYSAQLEMRRGAQSGTNGFVLPLGWDAPIDFSGQCANDWECSSNLTFNCLGGLCRGPNHNPSLGAFIEQSRPDFIFFGQSPIADVGTSFLDYTYFGTLVDGAALDPGSPVYAGTLILVVGDSACGSFRFTFDVCKGGTVVDSPSFISAVPELVPLVIQLPECPAVPIASDPPDCLLDARMPHAPNQPLPLLTADSILFTFDRNPSGLTPDSFRTRLVLPGDAPDVVALQLLPANGLRVELDRSIPPGSWSCVEHRASGREICLAALPGDVNGDGIVNDLDVREPDPPGQPPDDLLEWLRVNPQQLPRCDLDRSGKCTPLDILTMMNLMMGSGFMSWNGAELPSLCPSKSSDFRVPRGSCCNALNGACVDDVREENCQFNHQRWAPNTPCCETPCSAPTGACCERSTGECTDGVFEVNCQGIEQQWTLNAPCSSVACEAARGACCNLDTGNCSNNVLESTCDLQPSGIWYPAADCGEVLCAPPQ